MLAYIYFIYTYPMGNFSQVPGGLQSQEEVHFYLRSMYVSMYVSIYVLSISYIHSISCFYFVSKVML